MSSNLICICNHAWSFCRIVITPEVLLLCDIESGHLRSSRQACRVLFYWKANGRGKGSTSSAWRIGIQRNQFHEAIERSLNFWLWVYFQGRWWRLIVFTWESDSFISANGLYRSLCWLDSLPIGQFTMGWITQKERHFAYINAIHFLFYLERCHTRNNFEYICHLFVALCSWEFSKLKIFTFFLFILNHMQMIDAKCLLDIRYYSCIIFLHILMPSTKTRVLCRVKAPAMPARFLSLFFYFFNSSSIKGARILYMNTRRIMKIS